MSNKSGGRIVGRADAEQLFIKYGAAAVRLEGLVEEWKLEELTITAVRFKLPVNLGDEVLAVVSGQTVEGKVVAFHSGSSVAEVLLGVVNRLQNRSIEWKADQYG